MQARDMNRHTYKHNKVQRNIWQPQQPPQPQQQQVNLLK